MIKIRYMWWFLCALLVAALVTCESTETPVDEETVQTLPTTGTVEGYVYRNGGYFFVDDPDAAPTASTPAGGVEVRVSSPLTGFTGSAATGTDGAFSIPSIPPGYCVAEVREDPSDVDPAFSVPFSGFAGATVQLGRDFAISREAAVQRILGTGQFRVAPRDSALILGTLQPIPPGAEISVPNADVFPRLSVNVDTFRWLFYVDEHPLALFGHDVELVLVDASSGELEIIPATSTPAVNEQLLWASDMDYFIYDGVDPENLVVNDNVTFEATAEVVQMPLFRVPPPEEAVTPPERMPALDHLGSPDPNDWFYLGLTLDVRSDFLVDAINMRAFMENQGVPDANRKTVLSFLAEDRSEFNTNYHAAFDYLNDRMEQRVSQGGRPTLFVFLNAHHGMSKGQLSLMNTVRLKNKKIYKKAYFWNLQNFKACRVILILETCFAQAIADDFAEEFERSDPEDRPELLVFASCTKLEVSISNAVAPSIIQSLLGPPGALFTNRFLEYARIEDGDIAGVRDDNGNLIPEMGTIVSSARMHPQIVETYAFPAWCEIPETILTTDKESLVLEVPDDGSTSCSQLIGEVKVTNTTGMDVDARVEIDNPAVAVTPKETQIGPHNVRTFTFLYNCKNPSPFTTQVMIISKTENSYTDTAYVDVTIRKPTTVVTLTREIEVKYPLADQYLDFETVTFLTEGTMVGDTKLIDKATGQLPISQPWIDQGGTATWTIVAEGWNGTSPPEWRFRVRIDNSDGEACETCDPKIWVYTIETFR